MRCSGSHSPGAGTSDLGSFGSSGTQTLLAPSVLAVWSAMNKIEQLYYLKPLNTDLVSKGRPINTCLLLGDL